MNDGVILAPARLDLTPNQIADLQRRLQEAAGDEVDGKILVLAPARIPDALASFRIGGWDAETCDIDESPTAPVQVVCDRCAARSPWFTFRDDGGADRTAPLDEVVAWAAGHVCTGSPQP